MSDEQLDDIKRVMGEKAFLEMQEQLEKADQEMVEESERAKQHNFYNVKVSKNGETSIEIDNLRLCNKLRELGFFRFDQPDGSYQYVHISNNKIEIVNETNIKDAFENYVRWLLDYDAPVLNSDGETVTVKVSSYRILEKMYKNMQYYFSSALLDRLRPIDKLGRKKEIKIMSDTKYTKNLFFRNCAVIIHKIQQTESIEEALLPPGAKTGDVVVDSTEYQYLNKENGCIWESSILDRDFEYTEKKGDFEIFCELICMQKQDRKDSLMSILGYLMHDHYECDLRAAIFTDVNKEDTANAAGRTGKGLLAKALSYTLNRDPQKDCKMITVPGKGFDATNPKRYSNGDLSTQLIHIEDLNKRFTLETLYGDITDAAVFQKHYQNPTFRKVKMMLSMNQALRLSGSSDKGRVIIFELANFFSDRCRPGAYFGALHGMHGKERRFFESDWNKDDWNQFYSFMIRCCKIYLQYGILEPQNINFIERAAKEAVGEDLWVYLERCFGEIHTGTRAAFEKGTLYIEFCKKYPNQINTQRRFTELCSEYLRCKNIRSAVWRDGKDWIILYPDTSDANKKNIQFIVK